MAKGEVKWDKNYDYENSVSLLYNNDSHRGPGMVVRNLTKGLKSIGVSIHNRFDSRPWKYTGCLQDYDRNFLMHYVDKNKPVLMGPNLFVLPNDNPFLCNSFNDFVVPAQWVKDLYLKFDLLKNKNMHVWPVGIDTEEWNFENDKKETTNLNCFIYYKNRSENDLAIAQAVCNKFNLKYEIIKYGSYQEQELKSLCKKMSHNNGFAILLTGTESQGVAYQNILSSNVPCYVFNSPTWKSDDSSIVVPASSVPYFDKTCGEISNNINLEQFENFIKNVASNKYKPRHFVIQNLNIEKQATEYLALLKLAHKDLSEI